MGFRVRRKCCIYDASLRKGVFAFNHFIDQTADQLIDSYSGE